MDTQLDSRWYIAHKHPTQSVDNVSLTDTQPN